MVQRPNVLWLMTDQHNARCAGFAGHPEVRTPALDRLAREAVVFSRAYCNNPICSPSRISFMTGQYVHAHGMFGNLHSDWPEPNPDTLACRMRAHGYQTALIGKSHLTRRWDSDGYEYIRYTDLCDATFRDPRTTHYFRYLVERGLADLYNEGEGLPAKSVTDADGSVPAALPYEHSIERFTGEETLRFLEQRDRSRPFFVQMSFQRPHPPINPAREHFHLYDPDALTLPANAADFLERRFAGKPACQRAALRNGSVSPLATANCARLRRALASYYALITAIDGEIGRVLEQLRAAGDDEKTVICFVADHGDFAGEHGLVLKNLGIYESIHRIPFVLRWPGGPRGMGCEDFVESVDLYPTLCRLTGIDCAPDRPGRDLTALLAGHAPARDTVFCEWDWFTPGGRIVALRTREFRLVFYAGVPDDGELYDLRDDPGEMCNRWSHPDYTSVKVTLLQRALAFSLQQPARTGLRRDAERQRQLATLPTRRIHKAGMPWSKVAADVVPVSERV